MKDKDLSQFRSETEAEFSALVHTTAYSCDNAFLVEDKIFKFMFRLQSSFQTTMARETEKLENKRRTFENATKIAEKMRFL